MNREQGSAAAKQAKKSGYLIYITGGDRVSGDHETPRNPHISKDNDCAGYLNVGLTRRDRVEERKECSMTVITLHRHSDSDYARKPAGGIWRTYEVVDLPSKNRREAMKVERKLHAALEDKGYPKNPSNNRNMEEFHFGDLSMDEVKDMIHKLLKKITGQSCKKPCKLYPFQDLIKARLLDAIHDKKKFDGILAELAPRVGKTLIILLTFLETKYQFLLLPSYILSALSSFEKELENYQNFDNLKFLSTYEDNFTQKFEKAKASGQRCVIGVSIHAENYEGLHRIISETDKTKKMAVVDEADLGAHTEKSTKCINFLDAEFTIRMSGTGIDRAASGLTGLRLAPTLCWSMIDMLNFKNDTHPLLANFGTGGQNIKSQREKDVYKSFSRADAVESCQALINPIAAEVVWNIAAKLQHQLKPSEQISWGKILKDPQLNEPLLKKFFRAFLKDEFFIDELDIDRALARLSLATLVGSQCCRDTGSVDTSVVMLFCATTTKRALRELRAIAKAALGEDWVVEMISGDTTTNADAEKKVNKIIAKAKKDGKQVLFLSMDMASRSFSVPEIGVVGLLFDKGGVGPAMQKISRALTTGKTLGEEPKTSALIVSFSLDSNRVTMSPLERILVAEAAKASRENGARESLQEITKRVFKAFNIMSQDLNGLWSKMNLDERIEKLLESTEMRDICAAMVDYDRLSQLGDFVFTSKKDKKAIHDPQVSIDGVQTTIPSKTRKNPNNQQLVDPVDKKRREMIEYIAKNIGELERFTDFKELSPKSAISSILKDKDLRKEVEDFYGVELNVIYRILTTGCVSIPMAKTIMRGVYLKQKEYEKECQQIWN